MITVRGASDIENVCIIGLGYIGLPTASLLASKGFQVHGVDVNEDVVHAVQNGACIIAEPSLDVMVKAGSVSGRLTADTSPRKADVFILSVPTPFCEGHKPDLSFVFQALESIAPYLEPGNLVILESTVPVGTSAKLAARLKELRQDLSIGGEDAENREQVSVAHCPERVLPGRILHELVENDRIVGGVDKLSTRRGVDFYKRFVHGAVEGTDAGTAEMIKLAENSFRDVNIAYANELSLLCDQFGLDVWRVIDLANRHPRVNILRPGPGVGGHCIAVDPWFLVDSAPHSARLIHAARQVNDSKPDFVVARVREAAASLATPRIACLGLSFKPDVDDLRESPAVEIVEKLSLLADARIMICEPHIRRLPEDLAGKANVAEADMEKCVRDADIVVALVAHKAFAGIGSAALSGKIVIDACGLWRQQG